LPGGPLSSRSTIAALGRLPEADEFAQADEIAARFGSLKRAFALVKRVTGTDDRNAIARRNTEDRLVYLALARRAMSSAATGWLGGEPTNRIPNRAVGRKGVRGQQRYVGHFFVPRPPAS
jgi:hypothetical protein